VRAHVGVGRLAGAAGGKAGGAAVSALAGVAAARRLDRFLARQRIVADSEYPPLCGAKGLHRFHICKFSLNYNLLQRTFNRYTILTYFGRLLTC
jgi:hypothetical protein